MVNFRGRDLFQLLFEEGSIEILTRPSEITQNFAFFFHNFFLQMNDHLERVKNFKKKLLKNSLRWKFKAHCVIKARVRVFADPYVCRFCSYRGKYGSVKTRIVAYFMQWLLCHKSLIIYLRSFFKFPFARTEKFRCKTSIRISLFLFFSFYVLLLESRKCENWCNKIFMLHFAFSKSAAQKPFAFIYKNVQKKWSDSV